MITSRETVHERMQIARDSLASIAGASDPEIESLTRSFEELAGQSSKILGLASTIVEYIEDCRVTSTLPIVQALGSAVIGFVEARLEATHGILEASAAEIKLLRRLSKLARSQVGIALRTRVLAMMTNIETGRLGASGAAFEYLAGELSNFSKMLSEDTDELENRTHARGIALDATNRILASEAPRLAEALVRIRIELGNELRLLESGLAELGLIPAQFKAGVEEIATQIAGAVAAIQSYDITRQQIDHVREAMEHIARHIRACGRRRRGDSQERSRASIGITVQIYQLSRIRETVVNWMSRIRDCMQVMLQVSASNLAGISAIVQEREHGISARLAHINLLESESKAQSEAICQTVGEHSSLLLLIDAQVNNAKVTRQTLHLLSLNTIVEADQLGPQGNAVLEIGSGISDMSLEWSRITDQSGHALLEILALVERIDVLLATFSGAGEQKLRDAQAHARAGLKRLRATSEFATGQACDIKLALDTMKLKAGGISRSIDVLERWYQQFDEILNHLRAVQLELEAVPPDVPCEGDKDAVIEQFSASDTTEVERTVLRAALGRATLPPVQQSLEGNGVELF